MTYKFTVSAFRATTYTKLCHQIPLCIIQQDSLHKILEDKQVQVATIQCYTQSFQPQQTQHWFCIIYGEIAALRICLQVLEIRQS